MRAIEYIRIKLIVTSLIIVALLHFGCSSAENRSNNRDSETHISTTENAGKKIPGEDFSRCRKPKCRNQKENDCTHCADMHSKFEEEHGDKPNPFKPHDIVIKYDTLTCEMISSELDRLEEEYSIKVQVNLDDLSEEEIADYQIDIMILGKIESLQEGIETEQLCLEDAIINWLVDRTLYEFLDSTQYSYINLSENVGYKESLNESRIKKCVCAEDLYLYHNPLIQMEGVIVQASTESASEGEGGASLNYYIQPEGDYPNKFARDLSSPQEETLYCKDRRPSVRRPNTKDRSDIACVNSLVNSVSNEGPVVAFLDSGLDPQLFNPEKYYYTDISCPELAGDVKGWNFVDNNNITHDDVGHGTLVASAFKYKMTNFQYNEYSVLPVKVLDSCGYGTLFTTVCGLYYAKEKKADIVNCSWGLYVNEEIMEDAIHEVAQDAVIVTSAGNKGSDLADYEHYPSEYSWLNVDDITNFNRIYEVVGLCHHYNSISNQQSFKYWDKSNFNNINYTESAIGYEDLINNEIPDALKSSDNNCTCNGTSYAAPIFAAHVARRFPVGDMKTNQIGTLSLNSCTMTPVTKFRSRIDEE